MIIKEADDKQIALDELKALLQHPQADAATKKKIEQEIKNIHAGARGENEVAYDLRAYLAESPNWMVIHDLRLEVDGVAFQIDHLIGNRLMDMFVCESKHFSEGVAINEHGEFTAFYGSKPYGIPSPIEQNRRHMALLQRFFAAGSVELPKRLGFTLTPNLKSLVLVSQRARVSRPKTPIEGLDQVIKNDQMLLRLQKPADEGLKAAAAIAKVVGQDTLRAVFEQIAKLHKPIQINWAAKFGLTPMGPAIAAPAAKPNPGILTPAQPRPKAPEPAPTQAVVEVAEEAPAEKTKQKLVCASCSEPVPYNVARFCWMNKAKFDGRVLCRGCQPKAP